jgi:hypothetical protein
MLSRHQDRLSLSSLVHRLGHRAYDPTPGPILPEAVCRGRVVRGAAAGLTAAIEPFFHGKAPLFLFIVAALVSAGFGGLGGRTFVLRVATNNQIENRTTAFIAFDEVQSFGRLHPPGRARLTNWLIAAVVGGITVISLIAIHVMHR